MNEVKEPIDEYKNRCVNQRYTSITTMRNEDHHIQVHLHVTNMETVDGWLEFDALDSVTGAKHHRKLHAVVIECEIEE